METEKTEWEHLRDYHIWMGAQIWEANDDPAHPERRLRFAIWEGDALPDDAAPYKGGSRRIWQVESFAPHMYTWRWQALYTPEQAAFSAAQWFDVDVARLTVRRVA